MIYQRLILSLLIIWLYLYFIDAEIDEEGSNVCYKKTIQVKYTYPLAVKTWKFCLKYPFRCMTTRTEYRIGVRSENKTIVERLAYCCDGYYQQGEKCKPYCPNSCIHGDCSAPNICDCQLGFGGPSCNITCPPHKFGFNCEYDCTCLTKPHCNKNYEDCSCKPGEISNKCRNICKCKSSICNPGFIGTNCETPCPTGTFGSMCIGKCLCNESNTLECTKDTGDCRCKPPFYGIYCEHKCASGKLICETPNNCECVSEPKYNNDKFAKENTLRLERDPNTTNSKNNHSLIFSLISLLLVAISSFMLLLYKYKVKTKKLKRDLDLHVLYKSGGRNDQFDNPVYSYSTVSPDLVSPNYGISYSMGSTIQTATLPHRPKLNNPNGQMHTSLTMPRKPSTLKQNGYINNLSLLSTNSFIQKQALADATNPNFFKMKNEDNFNSNTNNIYTTIDEVQNLKDVFSDDESKNYFEDEFSNNSGVGHPKSSLGIEQPFQISEDNDSIDIQFKQITKSNELNNQFVSQNDESIMHYDKPNPKSPAVDLKKSATYEEPKLINQQPANDSINERNGHYDILTSNRSYYSNETIKK